MAKMALVLNGVAIGVLLVAIVFHWGQGRPLTLAADIALLVVNLVFLWWMLRARPDASK